MLVSSPLERRGPQTVELLTRCVENEHPRWGGLWWCILVACKWPLPKTPVSNPSKNSLGHQVGRWHSCYFSLSWTPLVSPWVRGGVCVALPTKSLSHSKPVHPLLALVRHFATATSRLTNAAWLHFPCFCLLCPEQACVVPPPYHRYCVCVPPITGTVCVYARARACTSVHKQSCTCSCTCTGVGGIHMCVLPCKRFYNFQLLFSHGV